MSESMIEGRGPADLVLSPAKRPARTGARSYSGRSSTSSPLSPRPGGDTSRGLRGGRAGCLAREAMNRFEDLVGLLEVREMSGFADQLEAAVAGTRRRTRARRARARSGRFGPRSPRPVSGRAGVVAAASGRACTVRGRIPRASRRWRPGCCVPAGGSCVGSGATAGSWNEYADELLGCQGEEVGELDPLDVDSDRVEEHRAADAVVLAHRHLGGDPAADR